MPNNTDIDMVLEVERLQLALQAAHVGTWDYNLETGSAQWSSICKELFGLTSDATVTAAVLLDQVHPDDRERVRQANARILSPQSNGEHNVVFRTLGANGFHKWVQAKGRTITNASGEIIRFNGIVFDVTTLKQAQEAQQHFTEALEQRVTERTLALHEANQQLKKSNDSLTEFAFIASHDLQEPLRKIQAFGDLLKNNCGPELGKNLDYLVRIQQAASRMSTLIKDLLTFSRLSTRQQISSLVSLSKVVSVVLDDAELAVQETGALVDVGPLPSVQGDSSQLNQLFSNLISNAIKFRRPGVTPLIQVSAVLLNVQDLPPTINPARAASAYYCIDVSDNGIGFDQIYVDRIFQVFQRLHGNAQFTGTGIGLAICEKVAANHGGAITATSQPGAGSSFQVYLPA